MTEQWQELKETITEMRDNDGTGTQQEVCKFLANYMEILEEQMQQPCEDMSALEYRDKLRELFIKAHYTELLALIDFPTEQNFETLNNLIDKGWFVKENMQQPCGDCISRQAAIDMTFTNGVDEGGVLYVPWGEVKGNLEKLPSVTPKIEACEDVVNREAVLKYMETNKVVQSIDELNKGNDSYMSCPIYDFVKHLPSVTPQPCEYKPFTIDELKNEDMQELLRAFQNQKVLVAEHDCLLSVTTIEPCEDCISREATINAIYKKHIGGKSAIENAPISDLYACGLEEAVDAVESMPPVTPQRPKGKWIYEPCKRLIDETDDGLIYREELRCKCGACGADFGFQKIDDKFCKCCGSYNGGEEDGEDSACD